MRYLLDSCTLIWALENPEQLSPTMKSVLQDVTQPVLVSPVTLWEINLKQSIGKLQLKHDDWEQILRVFSFELLPIGLEAISQVKNLPWHHKDPFDRILIATAQTENLTICTTDQKFKDYEVALLG